MTPRRSLLLVLTIGLAVRLVNIQGMSRLPMAEYQFQAPEADMSLAYEWSGRILSGDLLGRDTVHAYTMWMHEIAPLAPTRPRGISNGRGSSDRGNQGV